MYNPPHSVTTTLLERGMPIEQIQKFLGHLKPYHVETEDRSMFFAGHPKETGIADQLFQWPFLKSEAVPILTRQQSLRQIQ